MQGYYMSYDLEDRPAFQNHKITERFDEDDDELVPVKTFQQKSQHQQTSNDQQQLKRIIIEAPDFDGFPKKEQSQSAALSHRSNKSESTQKSIDKINSEYEKYFTNSSQQIQQNNISLVPSNKFKIIDSAEGNINETFEGNNISDENSLNKSLRSNNSNHSSRRNSLNNIKRELSSKQSELLLNLSSNTFPISNQMVESSSSSSVFPRYADAQNSNKEEDLVLPNDSRVSASLRTPIHSNVNPADLSSDSQYQQLHASHMQQGRSKQSLQQSISPFRYALEAEQMKSKRKTMERETQRMEDEVKFLKQNLLSEIYKQKQYEKSKLFRLVYIFEVASERVHRQLVADSLSHLAHITFGAEYHADQHHKKTQMIKLLGMWNNWKNYMLDIKVNTLRQLVKQKMLNAERVYERQSVQYHCKKLKAKSFAGWYYFFTKNKELFARKRQRVNIHEIFNQQQQQQQQQQQLQQSSSYQFATPHSINTPKDLSPTTYTSQAMSSNLTQNKLPRSANEPVFPTGIFSDFYGTTSSPPDQSTGGTTPAFDSFGDNSYFGRRAHSLSNSQSQQQQQQQQQQQLLQQRQTPQLNGRSALDRRYADESLQYGGDNTGSACGSTTSTLSQKRAQSLLNSIPVPAPARAQQQTNENSSTNTFMQFKQNLMLASCSPIRNHNHYQTEFSASSATAALSHNYHNSTSSPPNSDSLDQVLGVLSYPMNYANANIASTSSTYDLINMNSINLLKADHVKLDNVINKSKKPIYQSEKSPLSHHNQHWKQQEFDEKENQDITVASAATNLNQRDIIITSSSGVVGTTKEIKEKGYSRNNNDQRNQQIQLTNQQQTHSNNSKIPPEFILQKPSASKNFAIDVSLPRGRTAPAPMPMPQPVTVPVVLGSKQLTPLNDSSFPSSTTAAEITLNNSSTNSMFNLNSRQQQQQQGVINRKSPQKEFFDNSIHERNIQNINQYYEPEVARASVRQIQHSTSAVTSNSKNESRSNSNSSSCSNISQNNDSYNKKQQKGGLNDPIGRRSTYATFKQRSSSISGFFEQHKEYNKNMRQSQSQAHVSSAVPSQQSVSPAPRSRKSQLTQQQQQQQQQQPQNQNQKQHSRSFSNISSSGMTFFGNDARQSQPKKKLVNISVSIPTAAAAAAAPMSQGSIQSKAMPRQAGYDSESHQTLNNSNSIQTNRSNFSSSNNKSNSFNRISNASGSAVSQTNENSALNGGDSSQRSVLRPIDGRNILDLEIKRTQPVDSESQSQQQQQQSLVNPSSLQQCSDYYDPVSFEMPSSGQMFSNLHKEQHHENSNRSNHNNNNNNSMNGIQRSSSRDKDKMKLKQVTVAVNSLDYSFNNNNMVKSSSSTPSNNQLVSGNNSTKSTQGVITSQLGQGTAAAATVASNKDSDKNLKEIQRRAEERRKKLEEIKQRQLEWKKQKEDESREQAEKTLENERNLYQKEYREFQAIKRAQKNAKRSPSELKEVETAQNEKADALHRRHLQTKAFHMLSENEECNGKLDVSLDHAQKSKIKYAFRAFKNFVQTVKREKAEAESKQAESVALLNAQLAARFEKEKESREVVEQHLKYRQDILLRTAFQGLFQEVQMRKKAESDSVSHIANQFRKVVLLERGFRGWASILHGRK